MLTTRGRIEATNAVVPDVAPGDARVGPRELGRWWATAGVALAANLVWEYAHLSLYVDGAAVPWWALSWGIATDAVLVVATAALVAGLRPRWPWVTWLVLVASLLVVATVNEARAVTTGRWAYTAAMPTVGLVGVSPVAKLSLTGLLAVAVCRPWRRPWAA